MQNLAIAAFMALLGIRCDWAIRTWFSKHQIYLRFNKFSRHFTIKFSSLEFWTRYFGKGEKHYNREVIINTCSPQLEIANAYNVSRYFTPSNLNSLF